MHRCAFILASLAFLSGVGCDSRSAVVNHAAADDPAVARATVQPAAPPAASTGGFDAGRAYEHVRTLVEIGPRPPGSEGIHRAQAYIIGQLKGFG